MLDPLAILGGTVLEDGRRWGDVASIFQREDAAAIFGDDGPRWHFLTRPRGGSKTTDLAGVSLAWLAARAAPGARGYVVASDKDQAALLADAAAGLVARTPALARVVTVRPFKLEAKSGASLEVLASDGSGMFGLRPSFLVLDEFGQWPSTRNAQSVWVALLTSANKVAGCRMVILTSAGEPGHWSYRVIEEARRSEDWRVNEVPGPLPWADLKGLEAQRRLLTESQFARLHLNQWTQSEDRLVSAEDLAAATSGRTEMPLEPVAGRRYVVTLDLGLTNDRAVGVVAHAEPVSEDAGAPKRVVVDRMGVWQGSKASPVNLGLVEAWVAQASRSYNRAAVHADPWQAVGLLQRLQAQGVRASEFVFGAQSVGRVGQSLHLALRNRLISLPAEAGLLAELGRVRLRETSPGVVRLDHDSGAHDDQAVAIGVACAVLLGEQTSSDSWKVAWREMGEEGNDPTVAARGGADGLAAWQSNPGVPRIAPAQPTCRRHFWAFGACANCGQPQLES